MHRFAACVLILLVVGACAKQRPRDGSVRVTYTFENMRRFVDADGEPISQRDEWALVEDLIEDLRLHYHRKSNRFGGTFEMSRTIDESKPQRPPDRDLPGVVRDRRPGGDSQDQRARQFLRGRRFGPASEAAQVDPFAATVNYRSGFLRADLRVVLGGQAEPGTVVYLYDGVMREPRRVIASQAGRWESAVNISEGQSHIYGYFLDPRARQPVYFRVRIATRVFEEITRSTVDAEFSRDYPGRRFRLANEPPAGHQPDN